MRIRRFLLGSALLGSVISAAALPAAAGSDVPHDAW